MASLPSYVRVLTPLAEGFEPSVERVEMDRGPAKQGVMNSLVSVQPTVNLWFKSYADAMDFETWYFNVLKRVDWFDFFHPLKRQTLRARFVGGDIGELVQLGPGGNPCQRSAKIEYLR